MLIILHFSDVFCEKVFLSKSQFCFYLFQICFLKKSYDDVPGDDDYNDDMKELGVHNKGPPTPTPHPFF